MKPIGWTFAVIVTLIFGIPVWNFAMTEYIIAQRDCTMTLSGEIRKLGNEITSADSERIADGAKSIYPADLGIQRKRDYLRLLEKQLSLDLSEFHIENIRIANTSRSDGPHVILLHSQGTMRDIHTMIHNIGGYPNYKKGFLIFRKDGTGEFYEQSLEHDPSIVTLPQRTPAYLE